MKKLIISIFIFCFSFATAESFANNNTDFVLESHEPYYVGELGTRWQFPSDHLPRGATLENFHIAFWNVLNKEYLFHIEENTQGLRHSSIIKDNIPFDFDQNLTIREMIIGQMIIEMVTHPSHPRSLIALQETHKDLHILLRQLLPSTWEIVTPPNQPFSQDIYLYDTTVFEFVSLEAVKYSPMYPKTIFTINLKERTSNKVFRFVQSHIPGGPINSAEGCEKFSAEALRQFNPDLTIILMGDMNQSPHVIQQALESAAEKIDMIQPYTYLPIGYPSHANTKMEASWIDNFFIFNPKTSIVGSDEPEEINNALVSIVNLLNKLRDNKNEVL